LPKGTFSYYGKAPYTAASWKRRRLILKVKDAPDDRLIGNCRAPGPINLPAAPPLMRLGE
jgi:hypothetical protein